MSVPSYLDLDELVMLIDAEHRDAVRSLIDDYRERYAHARGSSRNHQAWSGGYWDHITDMGNIMVQQYRWMNAVRPLPFSLSEALIVALCHDLEKMVRFGRDGREDPRLAGKADKAAFRLNLIAQYGIKLTASMANALRYAEGVRDGEYTNQARVMGPLAAFVHTCDVLSARMWYDYPRTGDSWAGARRSHPDAAAVTLPGEQFDADGRLLAGR